MPCRNRRAASRIGAATPMLANDGTQPIATVDKPMTSNDAISMRLRPRRSPKWPNRIAPSGRAMNPTANVARDSRTPAVAENDGKNSLPNTNAAAVP
jgi:hypothetical protein